MIEKLKTILNFKLMPSKIYFLVKEDFELKSEKSLVQKDSRLLYSSIQLTNDMEVPTMLIINNSEDEKYFTGITHMTLDLLATLVKKEILEVYYTRKKGLDREIEQLLNDTTRRDPD